MSENKYKKLAALTILSLLLISNSLSAEKTKKSTDLISQSSKISVQLIEPSYKGGIVTSTKGGIIKGEDFYLQAKNIRYVRKGEGKKQVHKIYAEGSLFFEYKGKAYTGDSAEVDIASRKATITNGWTYHEPWFLGGKTIDVLPDGSAKVHDGILTTSEHEPHDWSIESNKVNLSKKANLKANNVKFMLVRVPVLWLPLFSTDLDKERGSPFKYRFRWGGRLGPRVGITYDLYRRKNFKAQLITDLLLKRGIGLGLITRYKDDSDITHFNTYNYLARDIKRVDDRLIRYRFQGKFDTKFLDDKLDFYITYDKLSDPDMQKDYTNQGIDTGRILSTEANLSRKEENWIASLNTKVRINDFQSIKQELPLFKFNGRPVELGDSGLILNNRFKAGYLDYIYAKNTPHARDFHSSRVELDQYVYKTFKPDGLHFTPYLGYNLIHYNNSPQNDDRLLAVGKVGGDLRTRFVNRHHAVEPYVQYDYYTTPSVRAKDHYIFDIQDGWQRLNTLRFGLKNFFNGEARDGFTRDLSLDIYGRAFFNTNKIKQTIPRVYLESKWKATPSTTYTALFTWNLEKNYVDQVNLKSDLTLSENCALALEWRHRSPYSFRKVDPQNFIVDMLRSEKQLRHSEMSDKRDTFLTHLFLRLSDSLSFEFRTRHGWGRNSKWQPSYNVYEVDCVTILRNACKVTFSFSHRAKDTRYSIDFSLGAPKPRTDVEVRRIGQGNYAN